MSGGSADRATNRATVARAARPTRRRPHRLGAVLAAIVLATATLVAPGLGPTSAPSGAVVGGRPTTIRAHPWQVALLVPEGLCGGTILSDRVVLTAAHCTSDIPLGEVWVGAGTSELPAIEKAARLRSADLRSGRSLADRGSVQIRRAKIVHEHPATLRGGQADLALVVVERPFVLGERVAPLGLAAASDVADAKTATVTGWGDLTGVDSPTAEQVFPRRLQVAEVAVVDDELCRATFFVASRTILCAGGRATDAAEGDSGGPLTISVAGGPPLLAGVTAFGWRPENTRTPLGGFVRVATFRRWIRSRLASPDRPAPVRPADLSPHDVCGGNPVTIWGTAGDDVLVGTPGRDVIRGFAGNDTIRALGGDDVVCADGGDDRVVAGRGVDLVAGGGGNDVLLGGMHRDRLSGGGGDDVVRGGSGNDAIRGGPGDDRLFGGPLDDFLMGDSGDDRLFGGIGTDELAGGRGANRVDGGPGDSDGCSGAPPLATLRCEVSPPA